MQPFGLYFGMGAATLAIERSSMTKEHSVCRTQVHLYEVIVPYHTKIQGASGSTENLGLTPLRVESDLMSYESEKVPELSRACAGEFRRGYP